jgi:hypothetical protein
MTARVGKLPLGDAIVGVESEQCSGPRHRFIRRRRSVRAAKIGLGSRVPNGQCGHGIATKQSCEQCPNEDLFISQVPFGNTTPEQTATKASRASEIMKFGFPGFDNLKTFEDYVLSYDRRNR